MNYKVNVNGQDVEVSKEVYDEYRRNAPEARHARYVDLESKKYEVQIIDINQMVNEYSAEDVYMEKLEFMLLNNALNQLNSDEKLLINILFFTNKSETQLAKELGLAKGTINYRKTNLLKKLRKMMNC